MQYVVLNSNNHSILTIVEQIIGENDWIVNSGNYNVLTIVGQIIGENDWILNVTWLKSHKLMLEIRIINRAKRKLTAQFILLLLSAHSDDI